MPRARPSIGTLILYRICPQCGEQNCPHIENDPEYNKMCEAYLKGDMETVNKIARSRYSQFMGMNRSLLNDAINKSKVPGIKAIPYNSFDLLRHYWDDSGRPIELSKIGLSEKVRSLVTKPGAFGKKGSIQSRFLDQFKSGERSEFANTYNFGKESSGVVDPLWAIGSATIKGSISNLEILPNGMASVDIDYEFRDRFTDPYDTFNLIPGEWNPDGTPYILKDRWRNRATFNYKPLNEDQIMNLLKR